MASDESVPLCTASIEDPSALVGRSLQDILLQSTEGIEKREHTAPEKIQHYAPKARKVSTRTKDDAAEESLVGAFCAWVVDHQIGIAMNLLLLLALTHICFPRARRHTTKFFALSYYNPNTGRYAIGWDDGFIVVNWLVIFTGLRIFVMEYLMAPLAQYAGIISKKGKVRFAEQAWLFIYAVTFFSVGMYIVYNSDYWLNMTGLWTNWPDREMGGLIKWYYLVQSSFWVQQIVIVNIEERRKDYWQMFTHHLVTCALMLTSYGYHHTKVGSLIACTMDSVDIILPFAKMLKYLNYTNACDVAFGAFVVTWIMSRHVIYMIICWSIYVDLPANIVYGCYQGSTANLRGPFEPPDSFMHLLRPFQDPTGMVCQTERTTSMFLGMLLFLQCIMLVWLTMLIRVVVKVLRGGEADDIRSDDEGEDEEDEANAAEEDAEKNYRDYIEMPPLEEEVGVDGISLSGRKSSPARVFRRSPGVASGVSIPSDRKELLGRIGCDKGS